MPTETILLVIVLLAGLYMAWNIGANDVANAMGTSVGSGALTLKWAVVIAACLEFSGAFFFGSHVSETVQTGIVNTSLFADDPILLVYGMLSALIAAGMWLQIASYFGWPVSTTHSIVGSIVGFGLVSAGAEAIDWKNVAFIVSSWIVSPVLGGILGFTVFTILRRKIFYRRRPVRAAKRLTPVLVFFAFTVFSCLLLSKGLKNLPLDLTGIHTTLISACIGLIAAFISALLVRRMPVVRKSEGRHPVYGAEVAVELDKAKKHLKRVQDTSSGELHYYVSLLIDEVTTMSRSLKDVPIAHTDDSEYATVERIFAKLQWVSASFMAFAHGANDVANAIGPLAACVAILSDKTLTLNSTIPTWLLSLGGFGIVVGLATWGWRVIDTIGRKLTELTPSRGFAAEVGAATTIVLASGLGLPISTTHTLVGAVLGVAFARGLGALNLTTTRDIVLSWIVTVPAGATVAIGVYTLLKATFSGVVI